MQGKVFYSCSNYSRGFCNKILREHRSMHYNFLCSVVVYIQRLFLYLRHAVILVFIYFYKFQGDILCNKTRICRTRVIDMQEDFYTFKLKW